MYSIILHFSDPYGPLRPLSVFRPFSSRGTFQKLLSVWRNLDTQNSANLRILREPRLKKTALDPVHRPL